MEEHEEHAHEFANDDDMRLHADHDCAKTFKNDLEKLIEYMEPQTGRDMDALIAVVDFVKAPEICRSMAEKVPNIYAKIEQQKGQRPFEGSVFQAAQQAMMGMMFGDDEQARYR